MMSSLNADRSETYLKLIAAAMIAGFLFMFGALLNDFSSGPTDASRARFERLLILEQDREG